MNDKEYMSSNWKILKYALHYWKILIGVAIVAGILATVFSSPKFIPQKFTSKAILYPSNLNQYGSETPLEQMLQYLQSSSIRDSVIQKFNLYDEYDIDPDGANSNFFISGEYDAHVSIEETEHEAVRVVVKSQDPVKAKEMVEEIIRQVNLKIRNTEREKYREVVQINEQLLETMKQRMDSLESKMAVISKKYDIIDLPSQAERVTEGYLDFLKSGKKGEDFNKAEKLYNNLINYGRHYHDLNIQLDNSVHNYNNALNEYVLAIKDYEKIQTYTNLIVEPEIPDKKSYPIRWLIVLVAMVSAVAFTFILLLVMGLLRDNE